MAAEPKIFPRGHRGSQQAESRPGDCGPERGGGLRPEAGCRNGKLYVAGFCWGGGQSFRFATNRGDLSAAFVFYGPPPAKDAMAHIKAPVYGFYAGNDARIGATVPDTISAMKAAGKTFDPVTYDGAGHGFMRAGEAPDASDANKKARDDSWTRWKSLLAK